MRSPGRPKALQVRYRTVRFLGVEIVGVMGRRPERRIQASGVSTNSRTLRPGEVFFALRGARCDGHDFVAEVLARGAAAAVVSCDVAVPAEFRDRVVRVSDTLRALCDSAHAFRKEWGGKVIAVTGSNGKTTTREMIYHILSGEFACKGAPKNFNTDVGLSLALFQVEPEDRVMVVEMGTNAPGEIAALAAVAEPDVGIITNVGRSHLEGLGSEEGVAQAKAELLDWLNSRGTVFLNLDNHWFGFLANRCRTRMISFGLGAKADFRGTDVRRLQHGYSFVAGGRARVRLRVPGRHNVWNALAALAVARHFGVDLAGAASRLENFHLPLMRCEMRAIHGVTVISDCYNANPDSMHAALEMFGRVAAKGRRVAVLGDMLELGAESERLHQGLGADAAGAGVDALWTVGEYARSVASAAEKGGFGGPISHAGRLEDVVGQICEFLQPGDTLLVKGSRSMRMERLVEQFRDMAPVTDCG